MVSMFFKLEFWAIFFFLLIAKEFFDGLATISFKLSAKSWFPIIETPWLMFYFHALKQRCRYISRSEGTFFKGNCLSKYSCSLWVTSLGLPCLCRLLSQQLGFLPSIQLLLLLSRKLLRLQTKKRLLKTQRNKVVTNVEDLQKTGSIYRRPC